MLFSKGPLHKTYLQKQFRLATISIYLQITNYKSQITNHKSQITNHKLQITNYKLQSKPPDPLAKFEQNYRHFKPVG